LHLYISIPCQSSQVYMHIDFPWDRRNHTQQKLLRNNFDYGLIQWFSYEGIYNQPLYQKSGILKFQQLVARYLFLFDQD